MSASGCEQLPELIRALLLVQHADRAPWVLPGGNNMKDLLRYCAFLVLSLLVVSGQVRSVAQETDKAPAPKDEQANAQAEPVDPLGRSTPHGTVVGFLQAAQDGKYKD